MTNSVHKGNSMIKQVRTKQRVVDHGEVFTAEREVNAMLDLVKSETERIDSRFLEPACGNGNFLAEILRRKMAVVKMKSTPTERKSSVPYDYELYAVLAVSSFYGVDILQDNVEECRKRLFGIWDAEYTAHCNKESSDECREAVRYILQRNILCGNALSLKAVDSEGRDTDKPIIFSEWSLVSGRMMQRRDFRLDQLLEGHQEQISIFMTGWEYDEEIQAFIPKPIKVFPLCDYRKVQYAE